MPTRPKPPKHSNNDPICNKCVELFNRYPGFHRGLWEWFGKLHARNPDAHISCAGRGRAEQQKAFQSGASKARYGKSAHNYNCAIDIFCLMVDGTVSYEEEWFDRVVRPAVEEQNATPDCTFSLTWYGVSKSLEFYERPHVQVTQWKFLSMPLVVAHRR